MVYNSYGMVVLTVPMEYNNSGTCIVPSREGKIGTHYQRYLLSRVLSMVLHEVLQSNEYLLTRSTY